MPPLRVPLPRGSPTIFSEQLALLRCGPFYISTRRVSRRHNDLRVSAGIGGFLPTTTGIPRLQVRGKKTKTVVRLDELPQGAIGSPEEVAPPPEEDGPSYPTVVLQARRNMQRFDNCVLLTRVGGFYELYFEQAEEYGPLLNLKVAQKKTNAGPVPMVTPYMLPPVP